MARKLDDIFNECLERIQQGESVESCISSYPDYAGDLEVLLRTSLNVRWRGSLPQPRPQFKTQSRAQFIHALQQSQQPQWAKQEKQVSEPWFNWHGALVPTLAAVLLLLFSGVGTVAASSTALPDEPLYPVKIAAEKAREVFTFSDEAKAELHVTLAETRVQEITRLADQGKTAYISRAADNLVNHLDEADVAIKRVETTEIINASRAFGNTATQGSVSAPSAAPVPVAPMPLLPESDKTGITSASDGNRIETRKATELRGLLNKSLSNNVPVLERAMDKTPDAAKKSLQNAIDASNIKRQQNTTQSNDQNRNQGQVYPPKTQGDIGNQSSSPTVIPPPKTTDTRDDQKPVPVFPSGAVVPPMVNSTGTPSDARTQSPPASAPVGSNAPAVQTGVRVGDVAVDFALKDPFGKEIRLSDFRGRKVLLHFWDIGCPKCVEEMPYFQKVWTSHQRSNDLAILAIDPGDSADAVRTFMKNYVYTFTALLDSDRFVNRLYDEPCCPGTLLIDINGVIRDVKPRAFQDATEIEEALNKLR